MAKLLFSSVASICLLCFSELAISATQGGIGSESTATSSVTLDLPELIRVSDLDTLVFPSWDGTNNSVASDAICIYDNSGGQYSATFTGSGTGGAFSLTNGTEEATYSVLYSDGGFPEFPISGGLVSGLSGAHQTLLNCNGTTNGSISLIVQSTTLATFPVGIYTGTLTMLVAPN